MPKRKNDHENPTLCFVQVKKAIVVMGGTKDKSWYSTVELYHIKQRRWSSLPDLQFARSEASSCCVGDNIYIFGGITCSNAKIIHVTKIEKLNLS